MVHGIHRLKSSPPDLRRCKEEKKRGLIDPLVVYVAWHPSQIKVGEMLRRAGLAIAVKHHYTLKTKDSQFTVFFYLCIMYKMPCSALSIVRVKALYKKCYHYHDIK